MPQLGWQERQLVGHRRAPGSICAGASSPLSRAVLVSSSRSRAPRSRASEPGACPRRHIPVRRSPPPRPSSRILECVAAGRRGRAQRRATHTQRARRESLRWRPTAAARARGGHAQEDSWEVQRAARAVISCAARPWTAHGPPPLAPPLYVTEALEPCLSRAVSQGAAQVQRQLSAVPRTVPSVSRNTPFSHEQKSRTFFRARALRK